MNDVLGSYKLSKQEPTPRFAQDRNWEVYNLIMDEPVNSDATSKLVNRRFSYNTKDFIVRGVERFAVARPIFQLSLYVERIKDEAEH